MTTNDPLLAPIDSAEHAVVGTIQIDSATAGRGRIRRLIYPPGFRWARDVKPLVNTELCTHVHVGFLARGEIGVRFADGCEKLFKAPAFMVVEPGHEGWNPGSEPAVLIEFDFERDTLERFGIGEHLHK